MTHLTSVIHDAKTNSVEATWEDAEGVQIKCHSYADVQMGMFRADVLALGGNIAEHEAMIATVEAAIVPVIRLLSEVQAELKQRVTAKRDEVQFGGADVGGVRIKTDPGSISLLDQALMLSQRKPNRVFKVKDESGQHMPMTAAQIGGVFDTLGERVALCWDNEAAHYAAIDKLPTIDAALAYDINTGWPA